MRFSLSHRDPISKSRQNLVQYRREYRFRYLPPRFGAEIFSSSEIRDIAEINRI
ncbi:hypothetical protein Tco_0589302, partial [Tanacetum coccineum]